MHELDLIYHYLKTLSPELRPGDLQPIQGRYQKKDYPAGHIIFSEGDEFQQVTFILKGLVKKSYLTSDGKEFIKEFTWENQITTPYASLLQKTPATYTMTALEDTSLLLMDYEPIDLLVQSKPAWTRLGKAFSDMHFLNREIREMELLKYDATERYLRFKQRHPHLLSRVKKQDIACYLGITPVSLSRLEKKLISLR